VKPDLLLLDVMMPGMTGPELWEEVRAQPDRRAPGDLHDGQGRNRISDDLRAVAHWKVVTKPFDPMTLGAEIRDGLGGEVAVLGNRPHSTQFRPISDSFRHYF
jgi:CheY-like chemotaxis protein